ncbi:hypothetical protein GYMLUDRAFT_58480 [Collybiopsis luxurians FD-317 M1]|uniref:Unplaced genomic scaffold GYMLUscaffold_20, whole genome shotgun sequence n=1 Tax=Collybiopsis luxurians FD-317 M1 TaxID=944289 RepID=A0A0D0CSL5_9AGAR|nr:hypothetical protein GYMLUDRAFT_58480 [Collybiopsis luxurians FD-317 M1]
MGEDLKSLILDCDTFTAQRIYQEIQDTYGPSPKEIKQNFTRKPQVVSNFCAGRTKPGFYGTFGRNIILDALMQILPPNKINTEITKPFTGMETILIFLLPVTAVKLMEQELSGVKTNVTLDEDRLWELLQTTAHWGKMYYGENEANEEEGSDLMKIRQIIRKDLSSLLDGASSNIPPKDQRKMKIEGKKKALDPWLSSEQNLLQEKTTSLQLYQPEIPPPSEQPLSIEDFEHRVPAGILKKSTGKRRAVEAESIEQPETPHKKVKISDNLTVKLLSPDANCSSPVKENAVRVLS